MRWSEVQAVSFDLSRTVLANPVDEIPLCTISGEDSNKLKTNNFKQQGLVAGGGLAGRGSGHPAGQKVLHDPTGRENRAPNVTGSRGGGYCINQEFTQDAQYKENSRTIQIQIQMTEGSLP